MLCPLQIVAFAAVIATVGVVLTVTLYCADAVQVPAVFVPITVYTVLVVGATLIAFTICPDDQL